MLQPIAAVGTQPRRPGGARRGLWRLACRPPRGLVGRSVLDRRGRAIALRAPRRVGGEFDGIRARATRRVGRRSSGTGPGAGRVRRQAQDSVVVPGSRQPVRRHGPGTVRDRAGVRRNNGPVRGGDRGRARKTAAGRHFRFGQPGKPRDPAANRLRPARPVRGGDGPGPALAVMGLRTRRGDRPQRRPIHGGLRRRGVRSRRRRLAAG